MEQERKMEGKRIDEINVSVDETIRNSFSFEIQVVQP